MTIMLIECEVVRNDGDVQQAYNLDVISTIHSSKKSNAQLVVQAVQCVLIYISLKKIKTRRSFSLASTFLF